MTSARNSASKRPRSSRRASSTHGSRLVYSSWRVSSRGHMPCWMCDTQFIEKALNSRRRGMPATVGASPAPTHSGAVGSGACCERLLRACGELLLQAAEQLVLGVLELVEVELAGLETSRGVL